MTRPGKVSQNPLEIFACDPTRKSKPNEVGNFDLRGSVCAGLTGRFAVSVAQVRASSNTVEGVLFVAIFAVVVRR
jgi:hypothetical protein